jgi:hypothetical protein
MPICTELKKEQEIEHLLTVMMEGKIDGKIQGGRRQTGYWFGMQH